MLERPGHARGVDNASRPMNRWRAMVLAVLLMPIAGLTARIVWLRRAQSLHAADILAAVRGGRAPYPRMAMEGWPLVKKPKNLPRDPNQRARAILGIAMGESDAKIEHEIDLRAVELGRQGGLNGGQARAKKLSPGVSSRDCPESSSGALASASDGEPRPFRCGLGCAGSPA
jgi:hypothetical protein